MTSHIINLKAEIDTTTYQNKRVLKVSWTDNDPNSLNRPPNTDPFPAQYYLRCYKKRLGVTNTDQWLSPRYLDIYDNDKWNLQFTNINESYKTDPNLYAPLTGRYDDLKAEFQIPSGTIVNVEPSVGNKSLVVDYLSQIQTGAKVMAGYIQPGTSKDLKLRTYVSGNANNIILRVTRLLNSASSSVSEVRSELVYNNGATIITLDIQLVPITYRRISHGAEASGSIINFNNTSEFGFPIEIPVPSTNDPLDLVYYIDKIGNVWDPANAPLLGGIVSIAEGSYLPILQRQNQNGEKEINSVPVIVYTSNIVAPSTATYVTITTNGYIGIYLDGANYPSYGPSEIIPSQLDNTNLEAYQLIDVEWLAKDQNGNPLLQYVANSVSPNPITKVFPYIAYSNRIKRTNDDLYVYAIITLVGLGYTPRSNDVIYDTFSLTSSNIANVSLPSVKLLVPSILIKTSLSSTIAALPSKHIRSGAYPPPPWPRLVLNCPIVPTNYTGTYEQYNAELQMRRKAEILFHKENSIQLQRGETKAMRYAYIAKGYNQRKQTYATQGSVLTDPNIKDLGQVGGTLELPANCSNVIQSALSTECGVPGPAVLLTYNPAIPLIPINRRMYYNNTQTPPTKINGIQ